ncbi:MAG TPA: cupin domain-containing protein [Candidatus Binataceae bacterium]|nr:cupin domain-containing protein [Candidatus Binataceae bacterium]
MITRREMMKTMAAGSAAIAAILNSGIAMAAEKSTEDPTAGDKGVTVTELIHHALPDAPGHEVVVVEVEYAPGAASTAHRHPGSTFAYVLEGSIESQVEPGKPVTYTAGQMWYELPLHVHRISRNASNSQPAKLLAFLVMKPGQQPVLPLA